VKALALTVILSIAFASSTCLAVVPGGDPGEAGVRDVENGWSKAFVTGDAAYLDGLLDPAYVSVGIKGNPRTKTEIIALARVFAKDHPGTQATPIPPTSTISVKGAAAVVTHHGDSDTSVDVFSRRRSLGGVVLPAHRHRAGEMSARSSNGGKGTWPIDREEFFNSEAGQ
jgi:hypothetical protein